MNDARLDLNPLLKLGKIIRVHIVVGGGLAYSIGVLLAILETQRFSSALVVLGYLVVLFGDLSTHYSNDYFDVDVDKDSRSNKFFSGKRILVRNPTLRSIAKPISIALMILSISIAGIIVLCYQVPIIFLIITIIGNLAGWFYSAPPPRLSSRGVGELTVAIITGWIIPSAGYLVVRKQFDLSFMLLTIPFVMYGFMLSLSLEAPDIEVDRTMTRRNLVVRKGLHFIVAMVLFISTVASILFLTYAWRFPSTSIDLRMITLFSIIPLIMGLFGAYTIFQEEIDINQISILNVTSLFVFNALFNGYCIYLIVQS